MTDGLTLGLLAIALLVVVKESGVPVPVPGDLVVIGAGVAAAQGQFNPWLALATIVVAGIAGGLVQFVLVRGVGRRFLLAALSRFGIGSDRIDRAAAGLRRRGAPGVAVARVTPGVRIVAIAASAVAALPLLTFLAGLSVGNTIFVAAHFGLGLVAGDAATRIVGSALGPLAAIGIGLAALGAVGWWLIRRRAAGRRPAEGAGLAWADAACPACLVLGALGEREAERTS